MNTTNSGISNLTINHTANSVGITELRGTQNGASVLTVLAKDSGGAYRTVWYQSGEITDSTGTNIHITRANLGLPATATESELTVAALKSGQIMIAKQADEFTQTKTNVNSIDYEIIDWRTMPELADELYKGDDVDAENKYDKIVSEINAQDKKLQLEQTSIEVEYKAVTSEKESVKKILDTNATASFKYFS